MHSQAPAPEKNAKHVPFQERGQFALIAAFPLVFVIAKTLNWQTYGVFDFHTFHLAGVLANRGEIATLYQPESFMPQFENTYGKPGLLPWFYPPILLPYSQFLALFPVRFAYLLNGIASVAFYYLTVARIFPGHFRLIITVSALPMVLVLSFGHPSLLFVSLLMLGWHLAQRRLWMGLLALTLSAIKPHLGGVALFLLFLRSPVRALTPSVLIFIAFTGGAALLYGGTIWADFLHGLGAAAAYLRAGTISQEWVSSAFAACIAMGCPAPLAALAHSLVLGLILVLTSRGLRAHRQCRWPMIMGMAAVFTTPYLMYYDLVYLLFPLALTVQHVRREALPGWIYLTFMLELALLGALGPGIGRGLGIVAFLGFATLLLWAWFALADEAKTRHLRPKSHVSP